MISFLLASLFFSSLHLYDFFAVSWAISQLVLLQYSGEGRREWCLCLTIPFLVLSLQWTVGGSKNKKKGKAGKAEKKGAMKRQMNKAASSGSSDKDSSAESSAPEEGEITLVRLFRVIPSELTCCAPWREMLHGDIEDHLQRFLVV